MLINVMTTADNREIVERIGRVLLEKRLIACAQVIGPIASTYWWKGAIEQTEEWLVLMKTREELYHRVESEILSLHPYEVPEIQAIAACNCSMSYKDWAISETTGRTKS